MPIHTEQKQLVLAVGFLLFLSACRENASKLSPEPKVKAATTIVSPVKDSATTNPAQTAIASVEEAAFASLRTPHYELKIFKAIPFVPKQTETDEMRLKPGFQYLVLDLSVQNIGREKSLDMGQVLLSASLRDKRGRSYPLNAMAMAAFTLDNPDPQHQAQYNAIWGKLQPGEVYRAKAIGFEVPVDQKTFTLSLHIDDNSMPQNKRQEVKFSLE